LDYSLAPTAKYPIQLNQAAQAYSYLINDVGIDPRNLIIGGDSAGANLALQLLRHISKPHPDIEQVSINFSSSLRPRKCILISPWVAMDHTAPSATKNKYVDMLVKTCGDRWAWNWKGNHVDEFTDPITVSWEQWKDILPPTLVISGEKELMYDDILQFCYNIKKVLDSVKAIYCRVDLNLSRTIAGESFTIGGHWMLTFMGLMIPSVMNAMIG
jgi:acetyl esterase/lipase